MIPQDMDMAAAPVELSRREREAIEAQRKKDHYMKLHAEGKTQEAQVRLHDECSSADFFIFNISWGDDMHIS